jgi:hypothetical protein
MDLSSSEGKVIEEKLTNGNYDWVYHDHSIILNNEKKWDDIIAMNIKFEKYDHPLIGFIHKHIKEFNRLIGICFHPTLPFAIISIEGGRETKIITWKENDKGMHVFKIFNSIETGQHDYKFSGDGKWVYFSEVIYGKQKSNFILMPVDPKLPYYLGKPILLGEVPDYPDNVTAMTRNPTGLVVSGCKEYGESYYLKKWDFTQAIPLIENGK